MKAIHLKLLPWEATAVSRALELMASNLRFNARCRSEDGGYPYLDLEAASALDKAREQIDSAVRPFFHQNIPGEKPQQKKKDAKA